MRVWEGHKKVTKGVFIDTNQELERESVCVCVCVKGSLKSKLAEREVEGVGEDVRDVYVILFFYIKTKKKRGEVAYIH